MPIARRQAAQLILEVIPMLMRSLASEWRHAEHGLTPGHFRLLFVLAEGPMNLSELAEKLEVSAPTMSNSVSILAERGWVTRRRDAEDRRRVLIELTPEGCHIHDHIQEKAESFLSSMLEPLSEAECQSLMTGLSVLRQVFDGQAVGTCAVAEPEPLE